MDHPDIGTIDLGFSTHNHIIKFTLPTNMEDRRELSILLKQRVKEVVQPYTPYDESKVYALERVVQQVLEQYNCHILYPYRKYF